MNRLAPAIVVAALALCPKIATAQRPDFKFEFVATLRNTVEVTFVDPKGLAWQMGLRKDDTILEINKAKIAKKDDLERALSKLRGDYTILVKRVETREKDRRIVERILRGRIEESPPGVFYHVRPK